MTSYHFSILFGCFGFCCWGLRVRTALVHLSLPQDNYRWVLGKSASTCGGNQLTLWNYNNVIDFFICEIMCHTYFISIKFTVSLCIYICMYRSLNTWIHVCIHTCILSPYTGPQTSWSPLNRTPLGVLLLPLILEIKGTHDFSVITEQTELVLLPSLMSQCHRLWWSVSRHGCDSHRCDDKWPQWDAGIMWTQRYFFWVRETLHWARS